MGQVSHFFAVSSHCIASHRIASHRIASHRSCCAVAAASLHWLTAATHAFAPRPRRHTETA